ncbi:hypothetical protein [Nocardia sp. CDC160]|uniref:hypothetical protein n=1 Tax=Nocardia sp. CDC160 TaxID=3112166 RepID=UPI002DBB5833|nr:hypothetical protein [Nocardia sp. CDC160]MEC3917546.1 hypothetical protein [Nocardia sp. CDC160]
MNSRKFLGALTVSAALLTPAAALAAPAQAEVVLTPAQDVDGSGSASGSATYGKEGLEFLVCLLKGSYTGSKYPLC